MEIMEIKIHQKSPVNGCQLRDIAENGRFLVMMIQKNGTDENFIPIGSTKLETGDEVVMIVKAEESQHVLEKFGAEQ